ncbi:MAG: trigger factor [Firmicutes bacterium]|nr:trigger factor [Candidatus Fermentithermobacillaceae bacterium]
MKVTTEKIEGSRVRLDVESPKEVVEEALDSAYKKVVKRVNIPGFRRGKAPKSLVARYYLSELYDEAVKQAIPTEYLKAVEEAKIEPVDDPEFSDVHFVEGEPLTFRATVYVYPDVKLEEYNDISVAFEMPTVSEEDIDKQIEVLKERMAELRPLQDDTLLEAGHYATCHVKSLDEGEGEGEKSQEPGEDVLHLDEELNYLEVGHDYPLIPGLGDALIGMKKGETRVFDALHPIEGEEARTARYQIEVKETYEKQVPCSTDEIATSLGKGSFEEVREEVKHGILEFRIRMAREEHLQKVQDELLKRGLFEIPEVMIAERAQVLLERLEDRLKESGIDIQTYLEYTDKPWEDLRRELMEEAEKDLRLDLVLDAISEKENIPVPEDAVDKIVEGIAAEIQKDPAVVRTTLEMRGALENLRNEVRRGRALNIIAERAALNAGTELPKEEEGHAETSEGLDVLGESEPEPSPETSPETEAKDEEDAPETEKKDGEPVEESLDN